MNVYKFDVKGIIKTSYYVVADDEDDAKDIAVENFLADINRIDILDDEFP